MHVCPVCASTENNAVLSSPYHNCHRCGLWFQDPLPPKLYEAVHEKDEHGNFRGHLMSDADKRVNAGIANWMHQILKLGEKENLCTLDVGSKYPYFAHCLKNLGCEAYGIDNLEIVPQYAEELGVPMIQGDFELDTAQHLIDQTAKRKFDFISLIHVFEHFYNPIGILEKLREIVKEDGHVYIRLPDHSVQGFERDLTEGHYTIHPYFYSFTTILELLVQAKNLFACSFYKAVEGAGQSDLILTPITRPITIAAGLIVKNEARDLPRCIESLRDVVSTVAVVDTGSNDNGETQQAAITGAHKIDACLHWSVYTDASEKDETGDWKLWNFSQARNQYVSIIDKLDTVDWLLWMDADDEVLTPRQIKRLSYFIQHDCYGFQIDAGGPLWTHHRMWKTRKGIKYDFAIHEYPTMGGHPSISVTDVIIRHDATPVANIETGNERNLRILEREWKKDPTSSRVAFYLANTHNDGGRYEEAVNWYQTRINLGDHYIDEKMFAYLYRARALRRLQRNDEAKKTILQGLSEQSSWSELWMELAYITFEEKRWINSIGLSQVALSQPNLATQLWRENNKYTDQPARLISWAYENQGNRKEALKWAEVVPTLLPEKDQEWEDRIAYLKKPMIALVRPGAIGDVIMTLRLVPYLIKKHGGNVVIHYYTSPAIGSGLEWLMREVGITGCQDVANLERDRHNFEQVINLVGYPLDEGYPEKKMDHHLISYFAKEMGLTLEGGGIIDPESYFKTTVHTPPLKEEWKLDPLTYVTIQPKAGWSVYKEWPMERWEEVIAAFPQLTFVQIGGADDPKLIGADHRFLGGSLHTSITLLANAKFHLGIDSFTNHLTGFTWIDSPSEKSRKVQALTLWGSTQYNASGYSHNLNLSLDLPCQPCFREDPKISKMDRGPCITPLGQTYDKPQHACMQRISVDMVIGSIRVLLTHAGI